MKKVSLSLAIPLLALTAGCGGGGSSPPPPPPPPPVVTGPTWTNGVFETQSKFQARCQAPRSGTSDRNGSALEEKHWLRTWSNDTYLWFDEITDRNPNSIAGRVDYFNVLKSNSTTSSGRLRDQFHFNRNTAEYQAARSSGASFGYGMHYAFIARSVPRDLRVSFVDTNSPATSNTIDRGAIILEVDGADLINGGTQAIVDTLNAGLFPSAAGETHTFKIRDLDSATDRTVTLTSASVISPPVNIAKTITAGSKKIGYLHFTTFATNSAEEQVIDAFTTFSDDDIDELVIDLRYNGGGFLDLAGEIGFMIAGSEQTSGKTFEKTVFNSKNPTRNPVTGATLVPIPFHSTSQGFSVAAGQALPSVDLTRVFILSTDRTCSASEAVINSLRGIDVEVVLVGTTTCGKPYGFYPTDNCGETYFSIQFQGENNKGFSAYSDGFTPTNATAQNGVLIAGCEINDDFGHVLGDEDEAQFSAALTYIDTGACPTQAAASTKNAPRKQSRGASDDTTSLFTDERVRNLYLSETSKILLRPEEKAAAPINDK